MKICVLVKEVPDAAVEKRINPSTGRLDRSGEKNLNPFDTHAIEAAMQLKEGGAVEVDEVVAVTMGPESAQRALQNSRPSLTCPVGQHAVATVARRPISVCAPTVARRHPGPGGDGSADGAG